ncbi:ferritin family protein [Lentisalinibacter salinarum]|uniref:rubrerythrin n=1 Tax=Lentisalinibacter salinarum TaxID=2992239 RepID=UPI00386326B6
MIDDIETFLRCAAALEADAAAGYDELAAQMRKQDIADVADLFEQFGEFSRLHLREMHEQQVEHLGRTLPQDCGEFCWPDGQSPENPVSHANLDGMTARRAIETAVETERRACDFYSAVAGQTSSEIVQELAQEFAEEEADHVRHLRRWLERL